MFIKLFTGLITSLFILAGCQSKQRILPYYNTADFTAEWMDTKDARYSKIHIVDTFSLQNQMGHTITKDSLDGYIYVANFFFTTCPGICPKMINNLQLVQDSFANNPAIKLVSFTVQPSVDSVGRLFEYGKLRQINPYKWYLLTGNPERINQLGRQSYFSEKRAGLNKDAKDFMHTESMLLVDKKGRIRGIYNGTAPQEAGRISEDIRTLMKEQ